MIRSLYKSNNHTRFIQLNIFLLSLTLLCVLFLTGSSFAYAQDNKIVDNNLKSMVFGNNIEQQTAQTFPPKVITILTKDGTEIIFVYGQKAEDILDTADFQVDYNDIVYPNLSDFIVSGGTIQIIEVDIEVYTEDNELPFETIQQESDEYDTGLHVIEVEGVKGASTDTIRIIYKDGIAIKKEVVSTEVTQEPVTKVIKIGTRQTTIASCEYWGDVVDNITGDKTKREWFKYVMWRESGCDSGKSSYGGGTFKGLMQFLPSTFYTSYNGENIWDGYEQIKIASRIYDDKMIHGEAGWIYLTSQWPTATKEFLAGARY